MIKKEIVINNFRINYYENNVPSKTILLVLHGFRSSAVSMNNLWNFKKWKCRLIAIDLLSHGFSENIENTSIELISNVVDNFIKKLNFDRLLILGHSLGAGIISHLQTKSFQPILVSPLNPYFLNYKFKNQLMKLINPKTLQEAKTSITSLVSPSFSNQNFSKSIESQAQKLLLSTRENKFFLESLVHQIIDFPLDKKNFQKFANLKSLKPIIIQGEDDFFVDVKSSQDLSFLIEAKLFILKNVGHAPVFESISDVIKILNFYVC